MTDTSDERRERYAEAMLEVGRALLFAPDEYALADAAMAVADAEQQAMLPTARRALEAWKKENAHLRAELEQLRTRAEKAEAAVARVRDLHQPIQHMGQTWCAECSHRRSTGPNAVEWVAYIPHPCPTLDAIEETQSDSTSGHPGPEAEPLAIPRDAALLLRDTLTAALDGAASTPAAEPPSCAECQHPKDQHQDADEPVSVGLCTACDEDSSDDAWHNYEPAAEA